MAVEVETRGQLQEFLGLIARRRWQVILPAALVLSLGVFFAVVVPKRYVVKTQVELRPVAVSVSPKEAANAQFQIKSRERVKKVTQALENREYLALTPSEQEDWLGDVQDDVKVTIAQSTNQATSFVNIEYSNVSVDWAVEFLRALRNDWIADVIERDRRKVADEVLRLSTQRLRAERQYQKEEQDLTEVLRLHGLSATQPVPGADAARSEDPVFERLRRNEVLLEETRSEIDEKSVLLAELEKRLEDLPARLEFEEAVGAAVSNAAEIAELDRRIVELRVRQEGLKPANSRYKQIQEEIRGLEAQRGALTRTVARAELLQRSQPNPAIPPLKNRIDALAAELRVAESRRARLVGEIDEDQRRVAELQGVYREVRERKESIARHAASLAAAEASYQAKLRESELLSSPLSNPFEITQEVATPSKPTEPNPLLIVSFSLVLGIGLGLGLAMAGEYSRNCFRTMADVGRVMAIPVLGTVQRIVTRREARLAAARRVSVAAASVVLVGAILFVTWAWANDAKYLSQDLRDAIEGLRARLK
ncbi:MAG: hypothetical protein JNK02_01510 [Planctomycetes bacterium]|nr:hypothetical protein [Planctomycetota bacterium]